MRAVCDREHAAGVSPVIGRITNFHARREIDIGKVDGLGGSKSRYLTGVAGRLIEYELAGGFREEIDVFAACLRRSPPCRHR